MRINTFGQDRVYVGSDVTIGEQALLNARNGCGDAMPTVIIIGSTCILMLAQIIAWRSVAIGGIVLLLNSVFICDADNNF